MRSSDVRRALVVALLVCGAAAPAEAQEARGFAVDRSALPVPGSLWLIGDSLDMHGDIGGAAAFTLGYARNALDLPPAVVSDRFYAGVGVAATYEWLRASIGFEAPFVMQGEDASVRGHTFTAPTIDPGKHPDTLADVRIGVDARVYGADDAPLRLGVGAQLFVPSGETEDYVTDHTYRAAFRVMVAGDLVRSFAYAGSAGVHVRTRDDGVPDAPRGSELLASAAAGPRLSLAPSTSLVIGPEIAAASAFADLLGARTTAVEGLITGVLDAREEGKPEVRLKLGGGGGLHAHFGAPEWRTTISIEVTGHVREPAK